MKLLNCLRCHDVKAVTPELRTCWCGKSKAIYDKTVHKEIYSGPAVLLGINDNEIIDIVNNMDENGFTKGVWVTIKPNALTILKVKDAATYKVQNVRRRLTARRRSGTVSHGSGVHSH